MIDSEYLVFEDDPLLARGKKTKVVLVWSKRHGDLLGTIRWYGAWRQYAFHPADDTIWNIGCMQDVEACITELMNERKS